jgi:hypothetical protein
MPVAIHRFFMSPSRQLVARQGCERLIQDDAIRRRRVPGNVISRDPWRSPIEFRPTSIHVNHGVMDDVVGQFLRVGQQEAPPHLPFTLGTVELLELRDSHHTRPELPLGVQVAMGVQVQLATNVQILLSAASHAGHPYIG